MLAYLPGRLKNRGAVHGCWSPKNTALLWVGSGTMGAYEGLDVMNACSRCLMKVTTTHPCMHAAKSLERDELCGDLLRCRVRARGHTVQRKKGMHITAARNLYDETPVTWMVRH